MATKTKKDKGCRMCVAGTLACEECHEKSHYKEAEKPKCVSCKWCNQKAFYSGKWYCGNPNISIFELPYSFDDCFAEMEGVL